MSAYNNYTYQVHPSDLNFARRITLAAFCDYLLVTAGKDAELNGFGIEALHAEDSGWVLSRMAVEVNRYPVLDEEFTVETWVEDVGKLVTTRNFLVRDKVGALLAVASTYWSKINLSTRQPVDLKSYREKYADCIIPDPPPIEKPRKVPFIDGLLVESRRVKYSDIDFNFHANSMKYLQWMVDELPLRYIDELRFVRMDINFMHELRYGDSVDIYMQLIDKHSNFGIRSSNGISVCRCSILWK